MRQTIETFLKERCHHAGEASAEKSVKNRDQIGLGGPSFLL